MTRELFSADPRVGRTDLARGCVFLHTYSCLSDGHSRDPRVRIDTMLAASCLKASLGAMLRTPIAHESFVEQLYQALAMRHTLLGEPRVG